MSATQTSLPDTNTAEGLASAMRALGQQAREAARVLARVSSEQKTQALLAAAAAIRAQGSQILAANARDMEAAQKRNLSAALLDRLALDAKRVEAMAAGIEAVAELPDPVGTVIAEWMRPEWPAHPAGPRTARCDRHHL